MTKTYGSKILATVHRTAEDLHAAGVMDKRKLREFDRGCLVSPEPMGADEIRALREREEVSQAVLARHLYVTVKLVDQWERGERRPSGPALKLLRLVQEKGLDEIA